MLRVINVRKLERCVIALINVCLLVFLPLSLPSKGFERSHQSLSASNSLHHLLKHKTTETEVLEVGKTFTSEINGEQERKYKISLTAGQFASITLKQIGVDVVVSLHLQQGELVSTFDEESRASGEESVQFVAEQAGDVWLSVRATSLSAPNGQFEIRVGEIRTATESERALDKARRLEQTAKQSLDAGKYDDVRLSLENALALSRGVLGREHSFVARLESQLGSYYFKLRDFSSANSLLDHALKVSEKSLGPEHSQTIDLMRALGLLNLWVNDRVNGAPLLQRAVDLSEKAFGPEHYMLAKCLRDVAWATSDRKKQEESLQRALLIAQKTVGPEHELVADIVDRLGILTSYRQDFQKAEQMVLRAQAIYQKLLGSEHLSFAGSFFSIGFLAHRQGQYEKAETYYRKAIEYEERVLGRDHDGVANTLNNLAVIYHSQGNYAKSLEMHLKVLRMAEKFRGPYARLTTNSLNGIAVSYAAQGNPTEAIRFRTRFEQAIEHEIELTLSVGSEREKFAYLQSLSGLKDRAISLNVKLAPNDQEATALAALCLLSRKGRLLDAMSETFASLRQRATSTEQSMFDQYNATTSQLARLVLDGPQKATQNEYHQKVRELEERKERLETEISRRSAEFRAAKQRVTVAAVRAAIPVDTALIEFAIYRPYDPVLGASSKAYGEPRYIAYLIRQNGELRWHDLGSAKVINDLVANLRKALSNPSSNDVRVQARAVDQAVMRPLRNLVGDARHLLISPDGQLNLVPFESLIDENGRYLVQRYSFGYLTSGRDLLRLQVGRKDQGKLVVFADPSFGKRQLEQSNAAAEPQRSVTSANSLSEVYFSPVNGTALEADAILTLFPDTKLLSGTNATEAEIKALHAPRILHVATHGFFLQDADGTADSTDKSVNPMVRSGLALAGANRRDSNNDGIFTALEASGLDLWGTKLVVLSACDTGVGEIRNGEGVYGLRRAFLLAGSESLVTSLWPASDYVTRQLMTNYYKNLKQGLGRGESLRQVQLDMLKRDANVHPFYWANFIQYGEWANLSGKR
jgi:CHAT domain-containing protein/tetratricopeptide (TPR) repeat protein